ncbi:hypothetical protein LT493_33985 [Streptomyces tricolor]|nr:hypothetical protein [Streptomyces tricolor]
MPPGTKASAEDSFSVATFEEVSLHEVYTRLKRNLLKDVPERLRAGVEQLLSEMSDSGDRTVARYLLTPAGERVPPGSGRGGHPSAGPHPRFPPLRGPVPRRHQDSAQPPHGRKAHRGPATDRQRILALGLPRNSAEHQRFVRRLVDFAAATGLSEPRHWCRAIAADPENWPLAFHHWPQENDPSDQTVRIEVDDLTALPKAGENAEDQRNHPALERLFGQPYLLPGGLSSLPVSFTVDPDPRSITGIKRFKVEICAETGDDSGDEGDSTPLASPTGLTATVSVTSRTKSAIKTTIKLKKGPPEPRLGGRLALRPGHSARRQRRSHAVRPGRARRRPQTARERPLLRHPRRGVRRAAHPARPSRARPRAGDQPPALHRSCRWAFPEPCSAAKSAGAHAAPA